uniref:Uncharacterized protein n=1 Tax=Caenorhabditis japonica TaxID=281687 RepID=A0A8R1I0Z1_CAEJA
MRTRDSAHFFVGDHANTVIFEETQTVCPGLVDSLADCSYNVTCPHGLTCYRDVKPTKAGIGACCSSHCPGTDMTQGKDYEESGQTMNVYCTSSLRFYEQDGHSAGGCCPVPHSAILFLENGEQLAEDEFIFPSGWKNNGSSGVHVKRCCSQGDCRNDEYCGKVRHPGTLKIAMKAWGSQLCSHENYETTEIVRFCFKKPFDVIDDHLIHNNDYENLDLCETEANCTRSSDYCEKSPGRKFGACVPIWTLISNSNAVDAHVYGNQGCETDEQCNRSGRMGI